MMKMERLAMAVLLLGLCAGSIVACPLDQKGRFSVAGLGEREVKTFFTTFREAISAGDKKKVASLVSYPIKLDLASGFRRTIRNRAEFIKFYDRIFDDEFRKFILKTEFADLWARWTGVATPRGEIWFGGIGKPRANGSYNIKIIAINGLFRT